MRIVQKGIPHLLLLITLFLLLTACGSDSNESKTDNNTVGLRNPGIGSPLSLPRSIVVGQANITNSASSQPGSGLVQIAAVSGATDYANDPVIESSLADSNIAMEFINAMLCIMDETKAIDSVNQGPYVGTVPYDLCSRSNRSGDASGTKIDLYINSTRHDDDSPQYIQIWMDDAWVTEPTKYMVEFVVYKKVGAQYPFGLFEVNYNIYTAPTADTPLSDWIVVAKSSMRSQLNKTGTLPRFEFLYNSDDAASTGTSTFGLRSVTEITSADLQNGQSRFGFNFTNGTAFSNSSNSIFDKDFNLESAAGISTCFSRNDIIGEVWAYNLYDAVSEARIPAQTTPIDFSYTHTAQNDRFNVDPATNSTIGKDFSLSYWGPGQLSIYSTTIGDTGYSPLNLVDGIKLIDANGSEYLVKAADILYSVAQVDVSNCGALDATIPINNSDLNLDNLPGIKSPSASLTDWPSL